MEKTIKADRKRKILKEEFLDDNALLEIIMEENRDVIIGLRFVDSHKNQIKEQILTRMSIYDYMSEYENLLKVSSDNTAIAIFKKVSEEEEYQLDKMYYIKEHIFADEEFLDITYREKFPNLSLDKHLILKSDNSNS